MKVRSGIRRLRAIGLLTLILVPGLRRPLAADPAEDAATPPTLIAPAVSTQTGLLLEPPLDLSGYSREKFLKMAATVGAHRIGKAWTNPVVALAPHPRAGARGLTEEEVREYMREARRRFDRGESIPMSDVGLISTQEDVIRQPMLNHIAAFSNAVARVYLLVQKTASDRDWSYFSIVQDLTVTPAVDYYAELRGSKVRFEGTSCYKCHSSGPLAIHPAREDLVLDARLAAALSRHIADQPRSVFHFPPDSPAPPRGEVLGLKFCTRCHAADGDRDALYQVHSHPIRVLVDFGYMPPNRRLKPEEIAELKAWLSQGPSPKPSK